MKELNETLKQLSASERADLLKQLQQQAVQDRQIMQESYEGIRADVVRRIEQKVRAVAEDVKCLADYVSDETTAFYDVMREYGQLRNEDQRSYTIQAGNFKVMVKNNKVKRFDERADIAAGRLIEFLTEWIKSSKSGVDDPMYQLAMTLLERNKYGDLDYKSISKLYELETRFSSQEYSDIMTLFKESNVVEGNATNFYFYELNRMGVWIKVEPSFNRM